MNVSTLFNRLVAPIEAILDPPGPTWPTGFAGAYLGFGARDPVFSGPEHSVLVIGPPRAGKTTALVIPALALWPGPAMVTSTKSDVLSVTARRRGQLGTVWCWDPDGATDLPDGVEPLRWTPLLGCADWDTALTRAAALVSAARPNPSGDQVHWTERAGALLATLLHAAALHAKPLEVLIGWLQRRESWDALDLLSASGSRVAQDLLTGIASTDSREQSGIWSSADSVLAAYRSTRALRAAQQPNFDPAAFVRSNDTAYLVCSATTQASHAPLVCALLDQVRHHVAARHSFWPPMLWALDEVANIAPLPNLPGTLAEAGGHGLLVMACLQDLSQARARWGVLADGFLTLFATTLLLPGVADPVTLRTVATLAGEADRPYQSRTRSGILRAQTTTSTHKESVLPEHRVAHGRDGHALRLYRSHPSWLRLTPWQTTPALSQILNPERTSQ